MGVEAAWHRYVANLDRNGARTERTFTIPADVDEFRQDFDLP